MTKPNVHTQEYLRRNLLYCASVGAAAGAETALERLRCHKRPPLWLVAVLEGILDRATRVSKEMAAHRDEVKP